jgi:perosamine synthetase
MIPPLKHLMINSLVYSYYSRLFDWRYYALTTFALSHNILPMLSRFKLVSCEVGPNYEWGDVFVASRLLFGLANQARSQEFAESWFRGYLDVDTATDLVWVDNGRTALYALLQSLELPTGSEVLIQGFSCVVLPNSTWQAGLKPILTDIDERDYNLSSEDIEQKITDKTKVVVVQHTFGIAAQMQKIVDICREYNLILIEDCAHALGVEFTIDGKKYKAGTVGHAAFYSFGRDKIISTTVGGVGYVNPNPLIETEVTIPDWQKRFVKLTQGLPMMSGKRVFQALMYPNIIRKLVRPFYHLQFGKVALIIARKLSLIGEIYTKNEKVGTHNTETNSRYSPRLFPLLVKQLKKVDRFNTHRRNLARYYAQELQMEYNSGDVYLRFPVDCKKLLLTTQKKERSHDEYQKLYHEIKTNLRAEGVLVGQWYTSLFMQPTMNYQKLFVDSVDRVPTAQNLSDQRILNLPTNIFVSQKDAERIVNIIKKTIAR